MFIFQNAEFDGVSSLRGDLRLKLMHRSDNLFSIIYHFVIRCQIWRLTTDKVCRVHVLYFYFSIEISTLKHSLS